MAKVELQGKETTAIEAGDCGIPGNKVPSETEGTFYFCNPMPPRRRGAKPP